MRTESEEIDDGVIIPATEMMANVLAAATKGCGHIGSRETCQLLQEAKLELPLEK
jgi:hypothetical protein